MSDRPQKKPSAALGAILIVLLLAAIVLGGLAVWRGYENAKWTRPTTAAAPAAVENMAPKDDTAEPSVPQATAQEEVSAPAEPDTVTLMALGDNLIHNTVYWSAETEDGGYDFTPFYADIQPTVQSYDIACINQETIFVKDHAMLSNYPAFGSPTEVGDALAETGFDVVTCATNHCYDKLDTGILDTCSFWRENHPDVTVLGIHDSEDDANTLRVVEKNNIKIAMLNYTYGLNYSAPEQKWMVDQFSTFDAVAADLDAAKGAADFVIVFAHWGEEGQTEPNQMQTTWAQFLADHGADLIIGGASASRPAAHRSHRRGRAHRAGLLVPRKLSLASGSGAQYARRHGGRDDREGRGRHPHHALRAEAHGQRHPPAGRMVFLPADAAGRLYRRSRRAAPLRELHRGRDVVAVRFHHQGQNQPGPHINLQGGKITV